METSLLAAVRRHADAHADANGFARTPIPGLFLVRAAAPSGLLHDIYRPLVCLLVQGSKQVTVGTHALTFSAGDSLLVTADVPTVSQITHASAAAPYYSLVLELDLALIAELSAQMAPAHVSDTARARVDTTDAEVADAALRLMRLLDRPEALKLLQAQLLREVHYWLLAGRHGPSIRQLGWTDGHAQRIARAVAMLREGFAETVPVERLADAAGMSASSFHQHFRAITSLSPLQFQKHLRLIEAKRLMLSEGMAAGNAAFAVGYESVPQFTREYARLFGQPPARDTRGMRESAKAA